MNKRGLIIKEEEVIPFDEALDHIPNIEAIIRKYYPNLEEYINLTTNVGLCIAITNENNIVIRNCSYDSTNHAFALYLPSNLEQLTEFQNKELYQLLPQMDGIFEAVSYKKMDDFDGVDISYTKEELSDILKNNLNTRKNRK